MRFTRSHAFSLIPLAATGLVLTGCSSTDELAEPALTTVAEASSESQPKSHEEKPTEEKTTEDKPKEEKLDDGLDPAGTICGEVDSFTIVTLNGGLSCAEAMTVFNDYLSGSPSGTPPQGSGAFWDAPNGWFCGGNNFLFPGDEDQKFNKYPSCGPKDSPETVVAVPAERVGELPV